MKKHRLLAAIMFCDIVGYTAKMEADEGKARQLRDRYRYCLQQVLESHNGELLEHYGDGSLSIFRSAIESCRAARQLQQALQESPKVPLRIGLHLGDIVYQGDDGVYGSGVNVASRIESLATPGSVLISERIYSEIKNQPDLNSISLGYFAFKNIADTVEVFALTASKLQVPQRQELKGKLSQNLLSIAVLPFVNMSSKPENEYLSDGITEEILNVLAKQEAFKLTARTSSFAFKNKQDDIRDIARKLSVRYIVEGSVRQFGDQLRITAQLIDAQSGFHIFSENYDRQLVNLFDLQDEISSLIKHKIEENILHETLPETSHEKPTENLEAYKLYLKGKFEWNKWSPISLSKAIKYFEQAIELASDFSLAYTWIASCYTVQGAIGAARPRDIYPKAKRMAEKAIAINPKSSDAYTVLGLVSFFYEWQPETARYYFEKAIYLDPNNIDIRQAFGLFLQTQHEYESAEKQLLIAFEKDPLSFTIQNTLQSLYLNTNNLEKFWNLHKHFKNLYPDHAGLMENEGLAYLLEGKGEKAIELLTVRAEKNDSELKGITPIAYAHAILGNHKEANYYLDRLKEHSKEGGELQVLIDIATVYAGLGAKEELLYYTKRMIEERLGAVVFLTLDNKFKSYFKEPEFVQLLEEVKQSAIEA